MALHKAMQNRLQHGFLLKVQQQHGLRQSVHFHENAFITNIKVFSEFDNFLFLFVRKWATNTRVFVCVIVCVKTVYSCLVS